MSRDKFRIVISIVLVALFVFSTLAFAIELPNSYVEQKADCCDEFGNCINPHLHNPYASDELVFDWYDYYDILMETQLQLRIHHEIEPDDIRQLILFELAEINLISPAAIVAPTHSFVNGHVFDWFVDENVHIELFGFGRMECCPNTNRQWVGVSRHSVVIGNVCVQYCSSERMRCLSCGANWSETRLRALPGCRRSSTSVPGGNWCNHEPRKFHRCI